jgi:hypothetical protein
MMPSADLRTRRPVLEIVSIGAALLLLLELSARLYLFGISGLSPSKINSVHGLPQTGFTQRSSQPGLGFELKPNLDGYFKLAAFRTNSRGLRDREYDLEKPDDCFRVAIVGSSFAMPAGVEIEGAFHSLLEEQFSKRFAPVRYQFINFSVGMYGPEQMLTMLESRALEYDPDLVVFTVTSNSAPRMIQDPSSAPQRAGGESESEPKLESKVKPRKFPEFRRSYPILQSFFVRLVRLRTADESTIAEMHTGVFERLFMDVTEWVRDDPVPPRVLPKRPPKPTTNVLERLAALGRRAAIPIAVVRLEFDEEAVPSPVEIAMEEETRALGMHFLDTRQAFRGTRAREFWIHPLDPHPNHQAHEIFAREVAAFLQAERLIPEAST